MRRRCWWISAAETEGRACAKREWGHLWEYPQRQLGERGDREARADMRLRRVGGRARSTVGTG
ncbi:hypothetical protein GCM10020367_47410 [Streptomyces sannanensis]|uniref:Uncharacterized protein n=1 Tax=Streptomyces sannanensis TaxID=285536 RepID=A0ABP6SGF7_9ACTN